MVAVALKMSFLDVTLKLLSGFGVSLLLFFLTLLLALPLGLVFCFGSMSRFKALRYPVKGFIYVIRGTPLMLQLMVFIYLPGMFLNAPITKWPIFGGNVQAAFFFGSLLAFVINYACYFSEIYRGGIQSIPKGQWEAGQVLGLAKKQIFFHIILLQVIKNILPPIGNETVTLVKDTSLARVVSVYEILFMANELRAQGMIWPLFYAGAFFLVFNALVTWAFARMEKKLSYFGG